MADETPKEVLRKALSSFDTLHLHKLMATAYDRWTWDTNSDVDKQWFEVADELLKERGMEMSLNGNSSTQPNVIGVQSGCDLTLKVDKLVMENTYGSVPSDLFEWQNGKLIIGFGMKEALVEFLTNELDYGSLYSSNGRKLRDTVGDAAALAIKERI